MAEAALNCPTTLVEFLAWEERQPERYELVGGFVRLMSGGTGDHDQIAVNIATALRTRLRGTGCFVHASNLKVIAGESGAVLYPDIFVRCGAPIGRGTIAEDPAVVFEVLSDSTARHDLTRKKLAYKAIPTLRLIVYVSQDEARLDLVRRGAGDVWDDDRPVEGLAGRLELPEVGASLTLAEIYEDTEVQLAHSQSAAGAA
jgi:Uma2 family endonuclease